MITVISGTNRPNSKTNIIAENIVEILKSQSLDTDIQLLKLEILDGSVLHSMMYNSDSQSKLVTKIQDKCVIPASKIIFVAPEYNGSIPGVLKLFIDAISIRKYKENFVNKKVALVGVSSGRAGNIVGLSHLRDMLSYLGMMAMPQQLPISTIEKVMVNDSLNLDTQKSLRDFCKQFLQF